MSRPVAGGLFIAEGEVGRQRIVPNAPRFFTALGAYLDREQPETRTEKVFVVLKGGRRGQPLSAAWFGRDPRRGKGVKLRIIGTKLERREPDTEKKTT